MQEHKEENIIALSNHVAFEKNELSPAYNAGQTLRDKKMDFFETLFRFLGERRHTVISFIRMKLDRRKQRFFNEELKACRNLREESRCVKKYINHLRINDARALVMSLPEMIPGKIEALIFHGERSPQDRLKKFAKTFDLSDEDALFCMFFFLMTHNDPGDRDALKSPPGQLNRLF